VIEDIQTFRDHFLSVYQSAVSEVARRVDEKYRSRTRSIASHSASSVFPRYAADIAAREFARARGLPTQSSISGLTERELTRTDIARACADLGFRYMKARVSNDTAALAEINEEFKAGTCDPAWATTFDEYLQYFGPNGSRKGIPYIRASAVGPKTVEFKADARIAIIGDWGTGTQPAIRILKHIAAWQPDVLIHLGDIYYSGTPTECDTNFTSIIQNVLRTRNSHLAIYSLAGNHDMYCGGVGYYDLIRHLNPEPLRQPASFFVFAA